MINNSLKTIILAAGESKRILSSKPKILHTIGGKTIFQHVLYGFFFQLYYLHLSYIYSKRVLQYIQLEVNI